MRTVTDAVDAEADEPGGAPVDGAHAAAEANPLAEGRTTVARTTVRPAAADDLEVVTALRLRFLADHRGTTPDELPADLGPATRDFVARTRAAGALHSWLAEDPTAGGAVGLVSLLVHDAPPRPGDPRVLDGYVINMWVAPSHRGAGVGTALLRSCQDGAVALGVRRLHLLATELGRPLYASAGFTANPDQMELHLPSPAP